MFFSIFGSKKEKAARRKDADTVSRHGPATSASANQREIARRTAQKIDEIESQMDLAIPARVGKPDAAPPLSDAGPAVPARVLPPSVQADGMVMFPSAGAAAAADNGLSLVPLDGGAPTDFLDASGYVPSVEVHSSGLLPVFEEAAVLFANGQPNEAAMILWQAIKENQVGNQTEQAWLMLFELYQAADRQQDFESLALDFASRFESSPPAWSDDLAPPAPVAAPSVASTTIVFPPSLDASAQKQIEQLQRAAQRNRPAEVDFQKINAADEVGASQLLRVLADFRKSTRVLVVNGVESLARTLATLTETGRRDESDLFWQLRLEVLRLLGDQTTFEDLAIDFCVTYEVSPPSWEPLPASIRVKTGGQAASGPATVVKTDAPAATRDGMFVFEGELEGRPEPVFVRLREYAEKRSEVIIHCRRLRRVDFVCAGEILNEVTTLRASGKTVIFKDLGHLVSCLLMVMGVHELAELKARVN